MIEVKQSVFLKPSEVCKSCYARSLLALMAIDYLKRNVDLTNVQVIDDNPVMWVRVDAIMDAFYSLGIIPDDVYLAFEVKIEALFNYQITPEEFAEYVKSLEVSILIS